MDVEVIPGGDEPCYVISVAARMLSVHPQTLRRYEDMGLVKPARVSGKRLYSPNDVERLQKISRLIEDLGVNLAGVEVILDLVERLESIQFEMDHMRDEFEQEIYRLRQIASR
jgi:MerR family transcriptional regulator, heat shock protein HspR